MSKMLKMQDGRKYEVVSENGKYYFCKDTQFRKLNPNIVEIIEVEEETKKIEAEKEWEDTTEEIQIPEMEEDKPAEKKKKKSNSKKKGE